jgi:hypothetical protein
VGLNSVKNLNLTNVYPNNKNNKNNNYNKVKSIPLELYELAGKSYLFSLWAQVKPKFDFKITYQVNTNFPVGCGSNIHFVHRKDARPLASRHGSR